METETVQEEGHQDQKEERKEDNKEIAEAMAAWKDRHYNSIT